MANVDLGNIVRRLGLSVLAQPRQAYLSNFLALKQYETS